MSRPGQHHQGLSHKPRQKDLPCERAATVNVGRTISRLSSVSPASFLSSAALLRGLRTGHLEHHLMNMFLERSGDTGV